MTTDQELLAAVDVYFRGLYHCDVELLDSVFDPSASLFDVDEGVVTVDPYPVWREVVRTRRSPASVEQRRAEEIVSVDWLWTNAASVRVRLQVLDSVFVDHLSFVRVTSPAEQEGWKIVAKVWHLESRVDRREETPTE